MSFLKLSKEADYSFTSVCKFQRCIGYRREASKCKYAHTLEEFNPFWCTRGNLCIPNTKGSICTYIHNKQELIESFNNQLSYLRGMWDTERKIIQEERLAMERRRVDRGISRLEGADDDKGKEPVVEKVEKKDPPQHNSYYHPFPPAHSVTTIRRTERTESSYYHHQHHEDIFHGCGKDE